MDLNIYLAEWFVKERLREAQRLAEASQWMRAPEAARRPLRAAVGRAMIRAGRWLLGRTADVPALGR